MRMSEVWESVDDLNPVPHYALDAVFVIWSVRGEGRWSGMARMWMNWRGGLGSGLKRV